MTVRPLNDAERWFAAEHALGLTEGEARLEAERRLERDAVFRAEVMAWHADLEPLLARVEPKRPPRRAFGRLMRAIDGPEAARAAIGPLRGFALFGAGSVLGALLLVAALGAGASLPGLSLPEPDPVRVALLEDTGAVEGGTAGLAVLRGEGATRLLAVRHGHEIPAGRTAELWIVPPDGTPRSLGMLGGSPTEATLVPVGDRALEGTIAVSVEPHGGSPSGAPTGPVVLAGSLSEI